MISFLFVGILCYLIGSVPTGFLLARYKGISHLYNHGSGAIGATNTARVLGKRYFFIVFFIDFLKACAAISFLYYYQFSPTTILVGALSLVIGNGYSIFIGFKGGRAIATSVGIVCALHPLLVIPSVAFWALIALWFKTVGIASCVALIVFALTIIVSFLSVTYKVMYLIIIVLSLYFHRKHLKTHFIDPLLTLTKGIRT